MDVIIRDNGCGMDSEELEKAQDPFYSDGRKHRHRKVGLGLPFLKQAVDLADGRFRIESEKGRGTVLSFGFDLNHLDSPPLGKVENAFLQILLFEGEQEVTIFRSLRRKGGYDRYELKRSELKEVLGNLEDSESLLLAREYLRNQEENLQLLND